MLRMAIFTSEVPSNDFNGALIFGYFTDSSCTNFGQGDYNPANRCFIYGQQSIMYFTNYTADNVPSLYFNYYNDINCVSLNTSSFMQSGDSSCAEYQNNDDYYNTTAMPYYDGYVQRIKFINNGGDGGGSSTLSSSATSTAIGVSVGCVSVLAILCLLLWFKVLSLPACLYAKKPLANATFQNDVL